MVDETIAAHALANQKTALADDDLLFAADPDNASPALKEFGVSAANAFLDTLRRLGAIKPQARAAATANISVASAPASVDGVTLAANDVVFAAAQTAAAENGPWLFNGAAAAMTRPAWFATGAAASGMLIATGGEGAANANKIYALATADPVTVGATPLSFVDLIGDALDAALAADFLAIGADRAGAAESLAADDAATVIAMNAATAQTLTVTAGLTTWPIGERAVILNKGAGLVTLAADTGVTLRCLDLVSPGQSAMALIVKLADNDFLAAWIGSGSGGGTAAATSYDPAGRTNTAATDVQAAINDLDDAITANTAAITAAGAPEEDRIMVVKRPAEAAAAGAGVWSERAGYPQIVEKAPFAEVDTPQASGLTFTVDVNVDGASILSTPITIDNTEESSLTAAVQPALAQAQTPVDVGQKISVDIDQADAAPPLGLKVHLIRRRRKLYVTPLRILGAAGAEQDFILTILPAMFTAGAADPFFTNGQADGGDIKAFMDAGLTQRLPLELAAYNAAGGTIRAYTRLSSALAQNGEIFLAREVEVAGLAQPAHGAPYGTAAVWAQADFASHDMTTDAKTNAALTNVGGQAQTSPGGLAARGYYTTYGVGTTDRTATAYTGDPDQMSIFAHLLKHGGGGAGLGTAMFKSGSAKVANNTTSELQLKRSFATARGAWSGPAPTLDQWMDFHAAHDGTLAAPVFHYDGAAVAVTQNEVPSGAKTADPSTMYIGNGAASDIGWDGVLSELWIFPAQKSAAFALARANNFLAPASFAAAQAGGFY